MNYRDLEAVRQIVVDATGLDIMYAYEDLVFPEHGAFMIQFDDKKNNQLYCYFHVDCKPDDEKNILACLSNESTKKKCSIDKKGKFTLLQQGENIKVQFR